MVHVLRSDRDVADLKITFDQLVIADLSAQLIESYGEIGILQLPSQRIMQGLPKPFGSVRGPVYSMTESTAGY